MRSAKAKSKSFVSTIFFVFIAIGAQGAPGDPLAVSDFRQQEWSVWSKAGTGMDLAPETDKFQNLLRAKDAGKYEWFFESPTDWFSGDKSLAYNGTLQVAMQAIRWIGAFVSDYDVMLVSSKKRLSLGIKGLRRDGETTRKYEIMLNEKAGWTKVHPGLQAQANVTAEDFITCLNSMVAVRVRGGFYSGAEETQLRSVTILQGHMAGDEDRSSAWASTPELIPQQHKCHSPIRYHLLFDNGGLPCNKWEEISSGLLSAVDGSSPHVLMKLDPLASSNLHNYYLHRRLQITGGPSEGSFGAITNYLGRLDWDVNREEASGVGGVTAVRIADGGSGCLTDGRLGAVGGGGEGFDAAFEITFSIPSVLVLEGGEGCGGVARHTFAVTMSNGGVLSVAVGGSGTSYRSGLAIVICDPPLCTGRGAAAVCAASNGAVTGVTVISGGGGYGSIAPVIRCPEGILSASSAEGSEAGGVAFAAVFSTNNGGIDRVFVTNPGSGYRGAISIAVDGYATCVSYALRPVASGSIAKVTVLNPGSGYSSAPLISIGTHGGWRSGQGCQGWDLRAETREPTASALAAVSSASSLQLGSGARSDDGAYDGMTLLVLTSPPQATSIVRYHGASKQALLDPPLSSAPSAGDPYAVTRARLNVLLDPPRGVDWASKLAGKTASPMACKCADAASQALPASYPSMAALITGPAPCAIVTGGHLYRCVLTLAQTAPAVDGLFVDESLYLMVSSSSTLSARILEYSGGSREVVVAVGASPLSVYKRELPYTATVPQDTHYLLSASHVATLGAGDRNATQRGAAYGVYLDDQSARVDAALAARHFFCDQLVGDDPPGPWISLPMRKTFAFRSVPRIGSAGTLTVGAEGRGFDDLLWKGNNLTVTGEQGEFLGTLFEDGEMDKSLQEGGVITDTITLSPEKMLEMTADRDLVVHFTSTSQHRDGQLRLRYLKLSFAPSAFYTARVGSDVFTHEDMPPAQQQQQQQQHARAADAGGSGDGDGLDDGLSGHVGHGHASLEFALPAGQAGNPAGDAVLSVTVDGHLAQGFLEVSYGANNFSLFRDWVWGEGTKSYSLSEPADIGVTCDDQSICVFNSAIQASQSRTPRHHAVHRIPRAEIQRLVAAASASSPARIPPGAIARFRFRVLGTPRVKLSPVMLSYPLSQCSLHTLSAADSPSIGASLPRPHQARLTFVRHPASAPAAAGDATLWVSAHIEFHQQHTRDPRGLPNQNPRTLRTSAETGEFYDTFLEAQRDPQAEILPTHHALPALAAFAVHVGDMGELVDRLFLDDFSQYAAPYVDSITIPKRLLDQLQDTRQLDLTLDIPPGIGVVRLVSAVIAYPSIQS